MVNNSIEQWCEKMRVGNSEYFKMCQHAYQDKLLDATSLAYDLQYMLGIEHDAKVCNLRKSILDSFQTGEEGFFNEKVAERALKNSSIVRAMEMHGNYLTFQAIGAYKTIEKLPERKISFYDQYISNIGRYLEENCPWDRSPWGAGGMIDNLGTILKCNIDMGYQYYSEVVDEVIDWLNRNQDDKTGLWMRRDNAQGINGLVNGGYHLMRGTYFLFNKPFDMPERIIDTIIEDVKRDEIFHDDRAHGCNDLDHFFLLQKCHEMVPQYCKAKITDLVAHRRNTIFRILSCEDGGFSFWADSAVKMHNYIEISPGVKESDMQGTVFYMQTINSMNKILDEEILFRDSLTHG